MSGCEHSDDTDRIVCARCVRAATSSGPGAPGASKVFTASRDDAGREAMAAHLDDHADVGRRPGWVRRRG